MLRRLLFFIPCLILLYLIPSHFSSGLRNRTLHLLGPLESFLVRQNTELHNFTVSIGQISSLREDKANLEKQVIDLQEQLAQSQSIARENQALRQEIGVTGTTRTSKKVLAHIIIRGSNPLDRSFTVDVGSSDGISLGQPAVFQGALIGKVISVQADSAVIRPITSRDSHVQAWISDSREKGLINGEGDSVSLSDITQGITVKPNSIVETSGLGGSLPQGILIGQIDQLTSKKSDLSQTFSIKLAEDPLGIESVFILLTNSQ